VDNGLLTVSNKINRINLEKKFQLTVLELYGKIDLQNNPTTEFQTDDQILHQILSQFSPGTSGEEEKGSITEMRKQRNIGKEKNEKIETRNDVEEFLPPNTNTKTK
jgi:hypothetical protein